MRALASGSSGRQFAAAREGRAMGAHGRVGSPDDARVPHVAQDASPHDLRLGVQAARAGLAMASRPLERGRRPRPGRMRRSTSCRTGRSTPWWPARTPLRRGRSESTSITCQIKVQLAFFRVRPLRCRGNHRTRPGVPLWAFARGACASAFEHAAGRSDPYRHLARLLHISLAASQPASESSVSGHPIGGQAHRSERAARLAPEETAASIVRAAPSCQARSIASSGNRSAACSRAPGRPTS